MEVACNLGEKILSASKPRLIMRQMYLRRLQARVSSGR